MKKIVIAGGTGFIGSYLSKRFKEIGYQVLIVSRLPGHVSWKPVDLVEALDGAELVINLVGKSINCRHTVNNRQEIIDSRLNSTIWLGNAVLACPRPPKLWINASAAGIYKPSIKEAMTEDSTDFADDFLASVIQKWEKTFFGFKLSDIRQIALRTSVVLGKNGGALKPLATLSRFGLGGKQGSGEQMFSWIHIEDYFRILLFLMENEPIHGIINCTSPEPLKNADFMHLVRKALRIPIGIPAPEFAIKLASKLIDTEPGLILNSSNVVPKRLLEGGFKFVYPDAEKGIENLLK